MCRFPFSKAQHGVCDFVFPSFTGFHSFPRVCKHCKPACIRQSIIICFCFCQLYVIIALWCSADFANQSARSAAMSYNNTTSPTKMKAGTFTAHVHRDGWPNLSKYQVSANWFSYTLETNENQELPGRHGNSFKNLRQHGMFSYLTSMQPYSMSAPKMYRNSSYFDAPNKQFIRWVSKLKHAVEICSNNRSGFKSYC